MVLYNLTLFAHLLTLAILFGAMGLAHVAVHRLRAAERVSQARAWLGILAPLKLVFPVGSLVLIATALRGRSKGSVAPLRISDPGVQRGLISLAASLAYCTAFKPLGFILATPAYMAFMMVLLGRRKPLTLVVAPVVVTLAIWIVFEKILHLDLPPGVLSAILGV
jgi:putative tricarboxylic transport membrane protein